MFLKRIKIVFAFTVTLLFFLSSYSLSLAETPDMLRVKGEGRSYRLPDEVEVKSTALDAALKSAIAETYDILAKDPANDPDPDVDSAEILKNIIGYVLDYRVLSEGWITHLVVEDGLMSSPPPANMVVIEESEKEPGLKMEAEDNIAPSESTPETEDGAASASASMTAESQRPGLMLYHVWIEANIDAKSLKQTLFKPSPFVSERTARIKLVFVDVTDFKEFSRLKSSIESVDIVKGTSANSFSRGKATLTAEVWGNPHLLLERLRTLEDTAGYDLIPGGRNSIIIKSEKTTKD